MDVNPYQSPQSLAAGKLADANRPQIRLGIAIPGGTLFLLIGVLSLATAWSMSGQDDALTWLLIGYVGIAAGASVLASPFRHARRR